MRYGMRVVEGLKKKIDVTPYLVKHGWLFSVRKVIAQDCVVNAQNSFNTATQDVELEIENPDERGRFSLLEFKFNLRGANPTINPFTKSISSTIFISDNTALPLQHINDIMVNGNVYGREAVHMKRRLKPE
jgi:hypothetical protein